MSLKCYANTLTKQLLKLFGFVESIVFLIFQCTNLRNTNGGEVSNENGEDFEFESVVALLEIVHSFNSVFFHKLLCVLPKSKCNFK